MAISLRAVIPIGKDVDKQFASANSSIEQTAHSITLEVDRAKNAELFLSGQISVVAGEVALKASSTTVDALTGRVTTAEGSITTMSNQITLKVDRNGVIGAINLSSEAATISASKINLTGYVTVTNLSTAGQTTINGSNVTTGIIRSANYVSGVSGMSINLANGVIDSKHFAIDANGNGYFAGTLNGAGGVFSGNLSAVGGTFTGTLSGANGTFTGSISANQISGGTMSADRIYGGTISGVTISGTTISGGTITGSIINGATINSGNEAYFTSIFVTGTTVAQTHISNLEVETTYINAKSNINTPYINNSLPITYANRTDYTFPPSSHTHSGYASSGHWHYSNEIEPSTTSGGNVGLSGINIASVNWCNTTFQPKSSSDFRLKHDFKQLDELPDELYMSLKPWQYKFKIDTYGSGIFFGLFAQEIESAFEIFGFNALDYNIIEIVDARDYTDEGQYVLDGKVHRVNYENFHAWNLLMIQKVYRKVFVEEEKHEENDGVN